jgi:type IV pilus assembly protein PilP
MRLVAIISGVAQPRAMLLDPTGVGHVVKRGDYLGRPEVLQTGGAESMPVTLNWRVARIRAGELVLTREDPTAPDRPPLTRSLPLYEEGEDPLELRRLALERERADDGASEAPPTGTPLR